MGESQIRQEPSPGYGKSVRAPDKTVQAPDKTNKDPVKEKQRPIYDT